MGIERPPWEADELAAFASSPTRATHDDPALAISPSRTPGLLSLVAAVLPFANFVGGLLLGILRMVTPLREGWDGIGTIAVGAIIAAWVALVCVPAAIALGAFALRRGRGAGLGAAGIAVACAVIVMFGGNLLAAFGPILFRTH
jgi:hypothetical protein